jgi:hypothetical protein
MGELTRLKACVFTKGHYKLDSAFRVGKVDVASSGTGFLEVFEAGLARKDLMIEPKDLQGAVH